MSRKKQIRILLTVIFWTVIYFIARSQRFEIDKNPYLMGIIYAFFVGHTLYEVFKAKKIENKKSEINSKHLKELKSQQVNFVPNISNKDLPNDLIEFIPLFKKWGIDHKMLREDLYENASHDELLELKSIENKREIIEKWIEEDKNDSPVSKALGLTIKSYDELGLWTWETKE